MIYIIFGLLGAVAGSFYFYGQGSALLGAGIGGLLAALINQRNRVVALEQRLTELESKIRSGRPSAERADAQAAEPESDLVRKQTAGKEKATEADQRGNVPPEVPPAVSPSSPPDAPSESTILSLELELAEGAPDNGHDDTATGQQSGAPVETVTQPAHPLRQWLLGGNIVVRAGVVVLLFGFAFLVKYAASHNVVPLEARLSAAFLSGTCLLVVGWRLRSSRFGYAITLQGGGIGVMYVVLFAAARLFHLVPPALVFGLMIGLVSFSAILAVLQNAAAMAVIGAAGGFMAPVLLSTGTGSHVMLFSYYALLNTGIFGIAWFKAWRWLNLLGFMFTFGIGSVWGVQYYHPSYLASTEPFLILFFVFYLAIAVLFALRQPPRLTGYVDGTLVFGMPIIVFTLQTGLVRDIPYGLAFSAVSMGLIYSGLATVLWRRHAKSLRTLVEALLALGVIFGSLAIPLALSGSWTAVSWSLEGAGLVWIGLRQRRWAARGFGLLLQAGSGALFLIDNHGGATQVFLANSRFLGGMMLGVAGLFSAFLLERYQTRLHRLERLLGPLTLTWGLVWWFATGIAEIEGAVGRSHEWVAMVLFIGISALAMGQCHRRWHWQGMRFPTLGLLPVMILAWLAIANQYDLNHPFQGWWALGWPVLFAVHLHLLYVMDAVWAKPLSMIWHAGGMVLATILLSWEAGWLLAGIAGGEHVWRFIAWGGVPAGMLWGAKRFGGRVRWPSDTWNTACQVWLPLLLAVGLAAWSVAGVGVSGNPRPLPYLPLLNPLDLTQGLVFLVGIGWVIDIGRKRVALPVTLAPIWLWGISAAGVLLWLTAVLARTVHAFAFVPYAWEAMVRSAMFQAAVSILWGLSALGGMVTAHRLRHRRIWFCGAGLLAVVVLKLFMVDLSGSGSISRIVSFLAVGLLMLVIGFFAPLPPAASKGSGS